MNGPRIGSGLPLKRDPVERDFARKVMEIALQIPTRMEAPLFPAMVGTMKRPMHPKPYVDKGDPRECRKQPGTYHMWLNCYCKPASEEKEKAA